MIQVFKIIHNYYDNGASAKLNFTLLVVLQVVNLNCERTCQYDLWKYSFCYRVINVWNSLPDYVVDSVNSFKSRSDKYWANHEVVFNFNSELTGTGGLPVSM